MINEAIEHMYTRESDKKSYSHLTGKRNSCNISNPYPVPSKTAGTGDTGYFSLSEILPEDGA
jgi:hypothetical protein